MDRRVWHDHYDDGVPPSVDYEDLTVHGLLERSAQRFPRHDALIFFNATLSYQQLQKRMGADARALSPTFNVKAPAPPTIIFHGQSDNTVPHAQAVAFCQAVGAVGGRCQLVSYPGQEHAFFNFGRSGNRYYHSTLAEMDAFLVAIGYLPEVPRP